MAFWSTKVAISLKRVNIEEKLLWGAYRNSIALFRTVPSPMLYGLPFPKILSQERVKVRTSNFACTFIDSIGTKAH